MGSSPRGLVVSAVLTPTYATLHILPDSPFRSPPSGVQVQPWGLRALTENVLSEFSRSPFFESPCLTARLHPGTHYIEEAERLCDRIAFIVSGRVVRVDTVGNLIQPIREKYVVQIACASMPAGIQDTLAESFPDLKFTVPENGFIRVESGEPVRVGPLVRLLEELGGEVAEARRIRPSLEDIFVEITGIEADAMRKEKEKAGGGQ